MKNLLTILFLLSTAALFAQLAPAQVVMPLLYHKVNHADINGDGHQDIIGETHDKSQLVWIENKEGTGIFENRRIIGDIKDFGEYVMTDLDGDEDIDVLLVTENDEIVYYINIDGTGNFVGPQFVDADLNDPCGVSIAVADLDDDGLNDVLFSENCSIGFGWYQNSGNGFNGFVNITQDLQKIDMYVEDFDLDGDLDILGDQSGELFFIEHLDGNGTFGNPEMIGEDLNILRTVKTVDVTGDGYPDLIYGAASSPARIAWKENNGDGSFGDEQVLINGFGDPKDLDVGDIDGDGDMDIVAGMYIDNLLAIFENTDGLGNFSAPIEISSGTGAIEYNSIWMMDMDNDGDNDLLTGAFSNSYVGWLKNIDGQGTFGDIIPLSAAGTNGSMDIAELDDTPGKDVVYSSDYGMAFLRNIDENHHFGTMNILLTKGSFTALADLNGDGYSDIIARDTIQNPTNPVGVLGYKMVWLQNDGTGDFSMVHVINPDKYTFHGFGDVDQDGDLDIIAKKNTTINEYFYLFENTDGLGNFGTPEPLVFVGTIDAFFLEDVNGDNYPDLIFNQGSPTDLVWHENLQDNTFAIDPQYILEGEDYEDEFIALDFDYDGDVDVAYMNGDDDFVWYENDGLGNFSTENLIVADGWQPGVYAFYDVDADQDMDLIYHVDGYSHFIWHLQVAPGVFGEAVEWEGVSNVNSFHFLDIEEDGDIDIFTNQYDNVVFFESFSENPKIRGTAYWDENQNGVKDSTELGLYQQRIEITPNAVTTFTTLDGNYLYPVDPGTYEVSCIQSAGWGFSSDSIYSIIAPTMNDTIVQDFGLIVTDSTLQIAGDLTSAPTRCGFDVPFWLTYENIGATYMDGQIRVEFDSLLLNVVPMDSLVTFIEVTPAPDSIVGLFAYWSFEELAPTHFEQIKFRLTMPGVEFIGDTLLFSGDIVVLDEEDLDTLFTNQFLFESKINCSYDPNDKQVSPSFADFDNYTLFSDTMVYTIRFQNTGTDTAFTVRLEDILNSNLDWTSLRVISASHNYEAILEEDGQLNFIFNDILLPPQIQNEALSHGFIKFAIQAKDGTPENTEINNTAAIFFDFNPPIITNTVNNILVEQYPIFFEKILPLCHDSNEGSISVNFPPDYFNFFWEDETTNHFIDSLMAGDYTLEITNNWGAVVATSVFTIDAPEALGSSQTTTMSASNGQQNGTASIEPSGGTAPYQYVWNSTPPQFTQTAINLGMGDYEVEITDAQNCTFTETVTVEEIVATEEISQNWVFEVSPNPSDGNSIVKIKIPQKDWVLNVVSAVGQKIQQFQSLESRDTAINIALENLSIGVYFLQLESEGVVVIQKIIVMR